MREVDAPSIVCLDVTPSPSIFCCNDGRYFKWGEGTGEPYETENTLFSSCSRPCFYDFSSFYGKKCEQLRENASIFCLFGQDVI